MGHYRGKGVGVVPELSPARGKFCNIGSKTGLSGHSQQIVMCGGGHWISPLCIVLNLNI